MEILSSDLEGNWSHDKSSEALDISVPNFESITELPDYSTEINCVNTEPSKSYKCQYGTVDAYIIEMDDATRYSVRVGEPTDQLSDTAVVSGTAWWTHPDLEHYKKIIRGTVKLGYPTIMVGPPTGTKPKDVSLTKATHDMQRILDELLPPLKVDPDTTIAIGASRAASLAIGLTVKKYAGKRTVPYADITAPPAPRAFTHLEWPRVRNHLFKEVAETRHTALGAAKALQLHRFAQTLIPRDKSHASNSARMMRSFIRGESGLMADHSDKKTAMHILEFMQDYWALIPGYEEKFREHKNVHNEYQNGYHIEGIARPTTRRDTYARLERLREERGFDGSFRAVDYKNKILPYQPFTERDRTSKGLRVLGIVLPGIPGYKKAA